MAVSETEIANLALRHLTVKPIASLTERSEEARVMNQLYAQVRDEVLRDFPWAFATRLDALALVGTQPNDEWGYSYQLPTDCLALRRVYPPGQRTDTTATRVPYRIVRAPTGAGQLIYTNLPDARAEWTFRETTVAIYSPDFVQALALLLAFYAAPSVTGGDQFKLGARAGQLYPFALQRAQANALGEQAPDVAPDADWIAGRN
jgi:hypothetical protein